MTEEEQLALALQMSMSGLMEGDMQPMETDGPATTDQVSIVRRYLTAVQVLLMCCIHTCAKLLHSHAH